MHSLSALVAQRYAAAERPALVAQQRQWAEEQPLSGVRVLDATPVFHNTFAKYLPLLTAGAELTVSLGGGIPFDPEALSALSAAGVPIADGEALRTEYDVVCDCAATHTEVVGRRGVVELTHSGAAAYEQWPLPVVLADGGRVKRIETTLGTGDGFLRALLQLGHPVPPDAEVLVFGGGKVGCGAGYAAVRAGATVTFVDPRPGPGAGLGCRLDPDDLAGLEAAIARAWCVVSATGVAGALAPWSEQLVRSHALLANLGVEDEFGPGVPSTRALHQKVPVNFALPEPTLLRYLDPTFALSNAAVLQLIRGAIAPGLHNPQPDIEQEILDVVAADGMIAAELAGLPEELT